MSIVFYTIGDWGKMTNNLLNVANSMDIMSSTEKYKPNFILSLGDNFYPLGVESTDDEKWTKIYSDVFTGKNLYCPWYSILGNHDYGLNPQAQIDYYKERIQYYQELIDKLGDNEEITERVIRLEKKLSYLLN